MKKTLIFLAYMLFTISAVSAQQGLAIGHKAPVFKAPADDGSVWDVNRFLGNSNIVVYFYPAAMTGGCTKQACSYRDHQDDLRLADAVVVGISGDKPEGLKLFKQAENLNFTLLSDEKGEIARAFGVPVGDGGTIKRTVGDSEHDLVRGVTAKRWTFVIGRNGKIIYKNEAVNAEKDTEEVLAFLKTQK
jgi:peroxiredoxin Q/BCP